jgi:hypothetical protein
MSHVIEPAPTGRARCRACSRAIARGELRFGERLPNPYADGENAEMTHWFHLWCAAFKRPEPFLDALATCADGVRIDRRDALEHEARLGVAHPRLSRADAVSRAASGRATCRACRERIEKGAWRIGLVWYEEGRFAPSGFVHPACAAAYFGTVELMTRLRHGSPDLDDDEFATIEAELGAGSDSGRMSETGRAD